MSTPENPETKLVDKEQQRDKFRWIIHCGWKGLCPRCGKGKMFRKWLKLADTCPECGLDYRFASPDDGPAFFSQIVVAFPLTFIIMWIQVVASPPLWFHLVFSLPFMLIGCALPLQAIKGWLVAAQYVNRAQEAGTENLWAKLHAREENEAGGDRPDGKR